MTLQHDSRIVRWAFLFIDRPYKTSLCKFFWLCVLVSPLGCIVTVIASPALVPVLLWQKYLAKPFRMWRCRREAVAEEKWIARYKQKQLDMATQTPKQPSTIYILWQGVKALKAKACPIITIEVNGGQN